MKLPLLLALAFTAILVAQSSAQTTDVVCPSPCTVRVEVHTLTPTPVGATLTPTVTRTHTATVTPTASPVGAHPNHCHAPTDHEHGPCESQWVIDAIVAWCAAGGEAALAFDCTQQRVVYGGNERSSPTENSMKHQAFKGEALQSVAGIESGTPLGRFYCRRHAASNPPDRSAAHHSYECYYQDTAGGVSFTEGHCDAGDPANPDQRFPRSQGNDNGVRPIILVIDQAAWDAGIRTEQWYVNCSGAQLGIGIDPTTFYTGTSEIATAHDMSTWQLTGALGLARGFDVFWTVGNYEPGTYCVNAWGSQGPCDDDHAMRFIIAPTLQADVRDEGGSVWIRAPAIGGVHACTPQCAIPN